MGESGSRVSNGSSDCGDGYGQESGRQRSALVRAECRLGKGQSAGRFVFSTDPSASGITQ